MSVTHIYERNRSKFCTNINDGYLDLHKDYNGERPAPPGSFVPRKDEYGVPIAEPQAGFNADVSEDVRII